MKMESLKACDLLKEYLRQEYANKTILVIFAGCNVEWSEWAEPEVVAEQKQLFQELQEHGVLVSPSMWPDDFIVIELPKMAAIHICNLHDHGAFCIEVWENGECIHENC